jgi:ketosteroid isomerase-like protein
VETEIPMDGMTPITASRVAVVRRAVGQLLHGTIGPLLDLLTDDVELEVADGGDPAGNHTDSGKRAVADYFTGLAGLTAFWQLDYTAAGEQVIAWGKEGFTIEGCGLEGACEFALVFELEHGAITRLLVIEDLRSYMRHEERRTAKSWPAWRAPGTMVPVGVTLAGPSWRRQRERT